MQGTTAEAHVYSMHILEEPWEMEHDVRPPEPPVEGKGVHDQSRHEPQRIVLMTKVKAKHRLAAIGSWVEESVKGGVRLHNSHPKHRKSCVDKHRQNAEVQLPPNACKARRSLWLGIGELKECSGPDVHSNVSTDDHCNSDGISKVVPLVQERKGWLLRQLGYNVILPESLEAGGSTKLLHSLRCNINCLVRCRRYE
jgi:hypothetical protein